VLRLKEATALADLCEGLPKEFQTYLGYCRALSVEQSPNYGYLKRLFQ